MLDYILDLTEKILSDKEQLTPKQIELICDSVSFALRQTKAHINSTRINNSDKASAVLSNIWQRTSNNIKSIKSQNVKQLVQTIDEKSKYWADPDSYDTEQFNRFSMRISQVEATINKLCN